jgi:hypothetical protein
LRGGISTGSISHLETHTGTGTGRLHPCPFIVISKLSSEVVTIHDRVLLRKVTTPRSVHA